MPAELIEKMKQLAEEHLYFASDSTHTLVDSFKAGATAMYAEASKEVDRLQSACYKRYMDQQKLADDVRSVAKERDAARKEVEELKGQVDRLSELFVDGKAPANKEESKV